MLPSSSSSGKPLYSQVVATPHLVQMNIQYETSSSSLTSMDSDTEAIAQKLGIADINDLATERFQVDRSKLETMIRDPSDIEGVSSAENFFNKIMKTTDTFIGWPRNLKLNARSRRDPFVRIVGRPDDNSWAKGLILTRLVPSAPVLKMRMAIPNTDHPHIIGRRGNNVNRIMEETETHIHFPDFNRRKLIEKSNRVSVYGSIEGLERARTLLRLSAPLVMSFHLSTSRPVPSHGTPFINKLENHFNVKVIYLSTPRPNRYLVLVKGTESEADKIKEAVQLLIDSQCGVVSTEVMVSIQMEIYQQFFDLIKGDDNAIISTIMEKTNTTIRLPDPFEMNQYSHVTITGSIEGVHEARLELITCLPIELIFDITENENDVADIMNIGTKLGVHITMHKKQRENTLVVTIRAEEKFVHQIYRAHQEIFELQIISTNQPEIPKAYLLLDPAYLRALENNINNDHYQYEIISKEIWGPFEPNKESLLSEAVPSTSTTPISTSLYDNITDNMNQPEIPKEYLLQEPAYSRALENYIYNDHYQFEVISREIWGPFEPIKESRLSEAVPSTSTNLISTSLYESITNNIASLEQDELDQARATLTPDSTDSSEAAYQDGRRSSDWVVMKTTPGDEGQHFDCDFDSDDLEVAFILMSSPIITSPVFPVAPGAQMNNGW